MYLWWSLCTLCLFTCQMRMTVSGSGLCCCVPYLPSTVNSRCLWIRFKVNFIINRYYTVLYSCISSFFASALLWYINCDIFMQHSTDANISNIPVMCTVVAYVCQWYITSVLKVPVLQPLCVKVFLQSVVHLNIMHFRRTHFFAAFVCEGVSAKCSPPQHNAFQKNTFFSPDLSLFVIPSSLWLIYDTQCNIVCQTYSLHEAVWQQRWNGLGIFG